MEITKRYKTIYMDPPWPGERGGGKIQRGANRHYNLMSIKEIENIPINNIAEENAHLYIWTTNNAIPQALSLINKWGFIYITCITWLKESVGLGQYFRGCTEHCLFCRRGNLPYKIIDGKRQQGKTFIYEKKGIHSQKPLSMYQIIEKVSYGPFIEIFAREQNRPGWDIWGNQAERTKLCL